MGAGGRSVHGFGVFCFFVASILLLMVTLSAPIINHLGLLEVELGTSTKSYRQSIWFGTFGFCRSDPNQKGHEICIDRHIGYNPSEVMAYLDGTDYGDLESGTSDALTRAMYLHPIGCGIALLAAIIGISANVRASILCVLVAGLAWINTTVVMITDFVLVSLVRENVNEDWSNSRASYGDAIWLVLAADVLLTLGIILVFFTCCFARRSETRARPAGTATRKKRFGIF